MSVSFGPGGMRRYSRRQIIGRAGAAGLGLAAMGGLAACGGDDGDSGGGDTAAAGGGESTAAAAGSETAAASSAAAAAYQGTLKIVGLGVDLQDPIKAAYEKAHPGITLEFTVKSTPETTQIVLTQPDSQDILSGYYHQMDQVWPSGNLMPIKTSDVAAWANVSPLITKGALGSGAPGQGDAPFRKIFAKDEKTLAGEGEDTGMVTMVPANHNSDSFGYNEKELGEQTSWAILVDPQLKGRVALIGDPEIGLIDASMAVEAAGVMTFADKGNMTKPEIDELMKYLTELKKGGHFRAFWTVFEDSVNLMQSGEVVAESMWSPAVTLLQQQDFPVRYAAPKEGYRGWGGGNAILSHVAKDPAKLAATLDYLNWWNTPEPAGIMARQGYYNATIQASRDGVTPAEASYWLNGEAAPEDLLGPDGKTVAIKSGQARDGGSYEDRCGNFNTWNSRMDEADYVVQKWQEFLNA